MRTIRRLYKNFQGEILAIPGRTIALVFFLILLILPLITQDSYILRVIIFACIFAIYAASWDFLSGFVGQMNLGHAAFFGTAAYAAALLNLKLGLPPWATIPVGALVAVAAGLVACIPALRLRGIYLALVTLALPIILIGIVFAFPGFTGGELGVSGITRLGRYVDSYYIAFVVMGLSVFAMWKLTDVKSGLVRTGVILHAIREDEIAARVSGINTIRYKMFAFAVSAFFAGIAGGLYVHVMRNAGPSTLELLLSFQAIIWTIFGGVATIYGAVTGVFILYPLVEFLYVVPELRMLIYAILIILILLFMPEGIAIWARDKMEERCPRCKLSNVATRQVCRACGASLHLERTGSKT